MALGRPAHGLETGEDDRLQADGALTLGVEFRLVGNRPQRQRDGDGLERASGDGDLDYERFARPLGRRRTAAIRGVASFVRPLRGSQSLFEGLGVGFVFDELAVLVAVAIVPRNLDVVLGGRQPQRLSRCRFSLSTPFGVTSPMEPRSCLAVRRLLPILPRDDRLTTDQAGGERIGDEAIANPHFDLLTLVTDCGGLRLSRLDGCRLSFSRSPAVLDDCRFFRGRGTPVALDCLCLASRNRVVVTLRPPNHDFAPTVGGHAPSSPRRRKRMIARYQRRPRDGRRMPGGHRLVVGVGAEGQRSTMASDRSCSKARSRSRSRVVSCALKLPLSGGFLFETEASALDGGRGIGDPSARRSERTPTNRRQMDDRSPSDARTSDRPHAAGRSHACCKAHARPRPTYGRQQLLPLGRRIQNARIVPSQTPQILAIHAEILRSLGDVAEAPAQSARRSLVAEMLE